jgi:hypothetical protein
VILLLSVDRTIHAHKGEHGARRGKKRLIVDVVARHTWREAVADSPCTAPCPARRPGRGAPGFLGDVGNGRRMEARQGAIRIFSGTPFPPQRPAAHHSASPDAQSGEPSPRANPCGNAPAFSRAQASPDRASGVRGGRLRCACGRTRCRAGDEDGGIGISRKILMAPCRASIPLPFPTRPRTCGATPTRRRALTPFHCIAGHFAPGERDAQFATKSAMNLFSFLCVSASPREASCFCGKSFLPLVGVARRGAA